VREGSFLWRLSLLFQKKSIGVFDPILNSCRESGFFFQFKLLLLLWIPIVGWQVFLIFRERTIQVETMGSLLVGNECESEEVEHREVKAGDEAITSPSPQAASITYF